MDEGHLRTINEEEQIAKENDVQDEIEVNEVDEETVLVPARERKNKSIVWNFFDKKKENGSTKAICKGCKQKFVGEGTSETSHLKNHMKICMKIKNKLDVKQMLLKASANKGQGSTLTMGKFKFNQQFSRNELVNMITLHEYPLAMVDHIGFRRYSESLNPDFKIVTRNTIKSDILKAYKEERAMLVRLLAENKSRVAITTDMWTCKHQKKGYMAVTAHFIDDDWSLKNCLIRFIYVPCPHNTDTLSKALIASLKSFDLDEKVSTITVDNCTTNDAIMDMLLEKLTPSKLIMNVSYLHMRCCAHILNLVVNDGMKIIKDAIEKVRSVVAYCTATPSRNEKFEDACRYAKIPITKKLFLDCKTMWNSCYDMLEVALLYKEAFSRLEFKVCKSGKEKFVLPTKKEWQLAKDICDKLAMFKRATDAFSGRNHPTTNLYFQRICEIRLALRNWLSCGNKVIESIACNMVEKFDKYWEVVNRLLAVASILDPRRKLECVSFYFNLVYSTEGVYKCDRVKEFLLELVKDYEKKHVVDEENAHATPSFINDLGKRPLTDVDEHENLWEKHVADKPQKKARKCEVETYLEEERIVVDENKFDILTWWNAQSSKYPIFSLIARDLLAVPISTVASESAFSTGGRVISPNRSRLHPNTVEALTCLQSWRRAQFKDTRKNNSINFATFFDDDDKDEDDEGLAGDD